MKRTLSRPAETVSSVPIFQSFFGGGFECSTHKRRDGHRLDLIAATKHDRFAREDYLRIQQQGLRLAREGLRWHLVETSPGQYNFSSALPIIRAAHETETQVIWDLCHFGWPDHLDLFKPDFVFSLARYGAAFAKWLSQETDEPGFFVPINEISFFSWAAGDEGSMFPFVTRRGFELKTQLVRGAIEAMEAIWSVMPGARFVSVEPIINVVAAESRPEEAPEAEAYRLSQFQAWDMLTGRLWPELGGQDKYLDILGVNFYPHNQWVYNLKGIRRIGKFRPLTRRHPSYRPFRQMLEEVDQRYHRPLFIAETGAENKARAGWLRYVCEETSAAMAKGIPVHGICLYPILNHPGWLDNRHCQNGLWDYANERGQRKLYQPLASELARWRTSFENHATNGAEASDEVTVEK